MVRVLHRGISTRILQAIAVVLGALSALAFLRSAMGPPTRTVVVARRDVAAGATFEPADVVMRSVPADVAPPDAAHGSVVGRVARVTVLAGTPLTGRHFAPAGPRGDVRLVAFRVDTELEVHPGDVIDVHATDDAGTLAVPGVTVTAVGARDDRRGVALTVAVPHPRSAELTTAIAHGGVVISLVPPAPN